MENFLQIASAFGGIAVLIVIVVLIVIFLFKKQLNPFIENMTSLKYKEFEINSKGTDKEEGTSQVTAVEETIEQISPTLESEIEDAGEEKDSAEGNLSKLMEAWTNKDKEQIKIAYEELQEKTIDRKGKLFNEAIYYSILFRIGEDSSSNFKLIEEKTKDTEVFSDVMNIVAKAYESTENYEMALSYYEKVVKDLTNPIEGKEQLISSMAYAKFMLGKKEEAYDLLIKAINHTDYSEGKFHFFKSLGDLYKKDSHIDSQILALEKALEIKPNHKEALFELAYAYSQNNQNKLAVFHYENLVTIDPSHNNALNNLGVSYQNLDLHFHKIKYYKKSVELGNTLASSNLANEYIKMGFETEARDILKQANSQEEGSHERVGQILVELNDKIKKENEAVKRNLEEAREERSFEKKLANSKFIFNGALFPSIEEEDWIDKDSNAKIEVKGTKLTINWIKNSKKYKFEGEIDNLYLSLDYYEMEYKFPFSGKEELGFKIKGKAKGYIDTTNPVKINIRKEAHDTHKFTYYEFYLNKNDK